MYFYLVFIVLYEGMATPGPSAVSNEKFPSILLDFLCGFCMAFFMSQRSS